MSIVTNLRNLRTLRLSAALLAASAALVALPACDWIHNTFMNSIPFRGNPSRNPEVHVYLGVDGLSYFTVKEAMAKGAFSGPEWKLSKLITMFPGTSDASWTRTMRTPKLGGYEIEYYDPEQDKVVNRGYEGLIKHVMPAFADFLNFEFDYLKAFDFQGAGYFNNAEAYTNTYATFAGNLDALFDLLGGRVQTASVFSAYLLEFDVLGHMQNSADVMRSLQLLSDRIRDFRKRHPERRIHFTLLSDHGMDFIRVRPERLIEFDDVLNATGVKPVETLAGRDPKSELYAIPIKHTRVTYLALHTHPSLSLEIAGRVTGHVSVDLAVTRVSNPGRETSCSRGGLPQADSPLQWYAVWSERKMTLCFAFDADRDEYYLPSGLDYARFGVDLAFQPDQDYKVMTDDALFAIAKNAQYPDLFYRTRTSLTDVSLKYPAEVIVSFRPSYASQGFKVPGKEDIASAGFHGAMEQLGTLGTLLTTERDLPDAVRSDNFLELFPRMKQHILDRGVEVIEGDRNASLHF